MKYYRVLRGVLLTYALFLQAMVFSAQTQMLLSKIQNSQKLALPYLTKWCLKRYLGREKSFGTGFRVQFLIFSEICFENWQILS